MNTISIEEAMAQSGVSLEAMEQQLTLVVEAHNLGPETQVTQVRDYLRQKLVSRITDEAIARAQG